MRRLSEAEAVKLEHAASGMRHLTPREREVVELIVQGRSHKEIAKELAISHRTVAIHRQHAAMKLGAANLADLIRLVVTIEERSGPQPTDEQWVDRMPSLKIN